MRSEQISKLSEQDVSTLGLPDLAFCGKPGTGKYEALRCLSEEFGYDCWMHPGDQSRRPNPLGVECCCERCWWDLVARGFVIVRLVDPNASRRYSRLGNKPPPVADWDLDDTDREHLKADHTIENDGSKYDLYDEIVNVLLKERRRR